MDKIVYRIIAQWIIFVILFYFWRDLVYPIEGMRAAGRNGLGLLAIAAPPIFFTNMENMGRYIGIVFLCLILNVFTAYWIHVSISQFGL